MDSNPHDYGSECSAFQTDSTNLYLPYPASSEYQAIVWPPLSSTASFAPPPSSLSLPVVSPSIDQSFASALAATSGGNPSPYCLPIYATNGRFPSAALRQPRPHHIVEAPLKTVAPQLTLTIPPTYTPGYTAPALPQSSRNPIPCSVKRGRDELEESGQAPNATTRKKRRVVNTQSRRNKDLADVEPQSSRHAEPSSRAGHAAGTRQMNERGARPPAGGVENVPVLNGGQDYYGRMQEDWAGNRSRTRALPLRDLPGILNAFSGAGALSFIPPTGPSATAVSVLPGDRALYTPAFYEELRNIANSLVAQDQARTSGPSNAVAQCGSRIDEVVPGRSMPRAYSLRSHHLSTNTTFANSSQAARSEHLAIEGSGQTSGVTKKIFPCPFADSSGFCCEPTFEQGTSRRGEIGHSEEGARRGKLKKPKPSIFSRPTDVDRHILSVHMKVNVYCKRHHEGEHAPYFARFDGFQRHLRDTCLKKGELNSKHSRICREIARRFAYVPMPCYRHDQAFREGLSVLRVAQTPTALERRLRTNVEDIRRCECCRDWTDEEMGVVNLALPSATGGPRSHAGSSRPPEALNDDRLPPEEEEGVEEDPILTIQECPSLGFDDLKEQGQPEGSQGTSSGGVVPANNCDGTLQTTDPENIMDERARSLYRVESQPWYIDFGSEALDTDVTWMPDSRSGSS